MADIPSFHDDAVRFLAAIVESSDDAIIGKNLDGNILTWNRGAERLYGYSAADVIGRSIDLLIPDDRTGELTNILGLIRSGNRVDHHETKRRTKDGRVVDVSLTISPVCDPSGRIAGAATIARDITAAKQAELALRTSELRWRTIVNSAVDGIVVIDATGRIEAFNPAAERLFGYSEAEVLGRNVSLLMPQPYRDEHDGYLARYIATGHAKIIGLGREVTGLRRDGMVFPLHLSVGEMSVAGERKFTGIIHDLTSRVRLEEQLREQNAMARLGEMAAVVAHEVKNPLAGIRGAVQVIGGRLAPDSRDAVVAKEIVTRIDGLNALMKDLLLFARPPQPRFALLDVMTLVSSTVSLLTEDPAVKGIDINIAGSTAVVMGDPELLKIVLVNLLVNAAHAMKGRGTIEVVLRADPQWCEISLRDSGSGISADVREKIFTPFFTTKSRGTGLGLPTAKRFVEAHAGTLAIDSEPGEGTTVTVRLPLAPGDAGSG